MYTPPFPVYAKSAHGSTVDLIDGRQVQDFLLNYTASAVGHAHPQVTAAAIAAIEAGAPFGLPTEHEARLAEAIKARITGVELVRFTNSGSEATLLAIRAARAYSGRTTVAKAEGGYHGSHDLVDFSVRSFDASGERLVAESPGMPLGLHQHVVAFPYNDLDGALAVLEPRRNDLATVLVEVYLNSSGIIPATRDFLVGLATWCADANILLTVDEVASWRTSYHGAASDYGVVPDLVCLGKALGGGFSIGALGGKSEVMSVFDPRRPDALRHAGTFNAHPAPMAAGLKVLEILDAATITAMNALGTRFVAGIQQIASKRSIALTATNYGSVARLHLSKTPPRDAREAFALPRRALTDLHWALLDRGFLIGADGRMSVSAVTKQHNLDDLVQAIDLCIEGELAPELQ
ncbi:MAG: aspartate aminotransferase family protein [Aggregatilineales bacterium]